MPSTDSPEPSKLRSWLDSAPQAPARVFVSEFFAPAVAPWVGRGMRFWSWAASILVLIALITEAIGHLLAGAFFDILSDGLGFVMVLLLGVLPLANLKLMQHGGDLSDEKVVVWVRRMHTLTAVAVTAGSFLSVLMLGPWLLCLLALAFTLTLAIVFPPIPLALSPGLALLVLIFQLKTLAKWRRDLHQGRGTRSVWLAVLAAFLVFWVRPLVIGYHVNRAEASLDSPTRNRSLAMLRAVNAEYDVRRLAYGRSPAYTTWLWRWEGWNGPWSSNSGNWRTVYYLLTGHPHTDAPTPPAQLFWDRNDILRIEETGGDRVGSHIDGLALASSRIETKSIPMMGASESLWTLTFVNKTEESQEARAVIEVPDGGVVSGAWLWINDQMRPAAFGAKSTVKAAYQEVAVVRRHDPLLVTATDARRVLVQCFPVPAGKSMQIRLQITAPLRASAGGNLTVVEPYLVERNFSLLAPNAYSIFADDFPVRDPDPSKLHTSPVTAATPADPPAGLIRVPETPRPLRLTVLVDSSGDVWDAIQGGLADDLVAALRALPTGSQVRFQDTRSESASAGPWIDSARVDDRTIRSYDYGGGVDPTMALCLRMHLDRDSDVRPNSILWLHAPLPRDVVDAKSVASVRNSVQGAPALVSCQVRPGEDAISDVLDGDRRVFRYVGGSSVKDAVRAAALAASTPAIDPAGIVPLGGRVPAVNGWYVPTNIDDRKATAIGRLAASSRTLAAWYSGFSADKLARAAAERRLVTPLSGAVVLETREQYERYGLNPNKKASDSTPPVAAVTPEPGEWAVIGIGAAILGGLMLKARYRRRAV